VQRISIVPSGGILKTLIPFGSTWTYLDTGANVGSAWRSNNFRLSADWKDGAGQLGYGEGDETTVINYGNDPNAKHITSYFRKTFTPPSGLELLQLRVLRDDGVAVFLNGREMLRDNLAAGATYTTLASSDIGGTSEPWLVTTNFSVTNINAKAVNLIGAEVHQSAANSVDLSFDLELSGIYNPPPSVTLLTPANNDVFITPTNITLSASAFDTYGAVTNVKFYSDGALIGSDATSPFSFIWSNAPAGTHAVRAIATDDGGATNTSLTATIFVIGPKPTLAIKPGPSKSYLTLDWPMANPGYRLETTTNMTPPVVWEAIAIAPVIEGNMYELDFPVDPQDKQRFFRLVAP
jgi:hypothetical protein